MGLVIVATSLVPLAEAATIQGKVTFTGSAPAAGPVQMAADPICQQQHTTPVPAEEVVVNDNGTLRHVFVSVKEGVMGTFPTPGQPVVLNQQGCLYTPHVFGAQVSQPVEIVNSDSTLHNINAMPTANRRFNIAQPVKGMKTTKTFDKPEAAIPFKCNVHPWMKAYGFVLSHPFFSVTDASGSFTIANLPAGTYILEAWHEKYGAKTQSITVADGETKDVEFTFP